MEAPKKYFAQILWGSRSSCHDAKGEPGDDRCIESPIALSNPRAHSNSLLSRHWSDAPLFLVNKMRSTKSLELSRGARH